MEKYIEEQEIYTIDNKKYTVITKMKEKDTSEEIYNTLSRYVLQRLEDKS